MRDLDTVVDRRTLLKSLCENESVRASCKYSTPNTPMMPKTRNPNQRKGDRHEITPTQLFAAFSNERRQQTLAYLAQKPAAIALGDLAEYIAIKEEQPSYEWYERVLTELAHSHLPHLQDTGLVRYEAERESVELAVDRRVVAPYLRLAGYGDA